MSNCDACKEIKTTEPVPYIVHESAMARNERNMKRVVVLLVVVIIAWLATIGAFLYMWQLYDYTDEETVYTYQQDGKGVNVIGDRNGVDYNEPNCYDTETEENPNS